MLLVLSKGRHTTQKDLTSPLTRGAQRTEGVETSLWGLIPADAGSTPDGLGGVGQ